MAHQMKTNKIILFFFVFSDDNYSECNIACLNNQGELSVYSVSTLRQQLEASCLRREDIKWVINDPEYWCTCDLDKRN